MATEELTRLERDITLIEQTLQAMIQNDRTAAQLRGDYYQKSLEHTTVMR